VNIAGDKSSTICIFFWLQTFFTLFRTSIQGMSVRKHMNLLQCVQTNFYKDIQKNRAQNLKGLRLNRCHSES